MKKLKNILTGLVLCGLLLPIGSLVAGAEPELLLYERDPWLMVIGSDSPIVACYTGGRMIFLDRAASGRSAAVYKSIRLDEAEQVELRSRIQSLGSLQAHYELSHAEDQATTQLVFRNDGKTKQVSAYGGVPQKMAEFIQYLDTLQTRPGARVENWRPPFIEIMLWPFDYALGAPTPWPKDFPGLDSPATVKRGTSSYSIYLPAGEEEKFRTFMNSRDGDAVLLDGKKWSVAVRIPFPHEIPVALATANP